MQEVVGHLRIVVEEEEPVALGVFQKEVAYAGTAYILIQAE